MAMVSTGSSSNVTSELKSRHSRQASNGSRNYDKKAQDSGIQVETGLCRGP